MTTRQLTQVYLEPSQKRALQQRAKAKGTKLSAEIRSAVDAYLAGVTPEELDLLDQASRQAAAHIDGMTQALDATNKKLEAIFRELDRLKASGSA